MKEGWEYRKLGDVCEIYQPQTIASSLLKKDGQYPVFGANGMIGRYDSYNHEDSEVLLCCRGATCGAINVSLPFSWINGNAMVVRPINDSFLKSFLRYLLLSLDYSHIITGAAQPQITRKSISPISVPVPSLSEQQSIVDYLDAAFAKIDAMKTNAEKSLNEAKALFQASLKEMLEPKEGWEEKTIRDIGSVIAGTTPNTNVAEYWDGNLCWISPAELDGSHYLYDSRKKITEAAVKAKSLKLLPEGTVILSSRAPIGKVVINKVPTYCNQGFKCVVCGKEIYNEFLYWWFWGKTEYLNSLGTGATFKEISKRVVEEILIPVPPLSEQQSIVATLDSLKSKVDSLQANFDTMSQECDALKQAILKQVFE